MLLKSIPSDHTHFCCCERIGSICKRCMGGADLSMAVTDAWKSWQFFENRWVLHWQMPIRPWPNQLSSPV
jgi:hypothetical protein